MALGEEEVRRGASASHDPVSARIERVHRTIRGFLDQLDEVSEPGAMLQHLDSLAELLPGHFADEEGPEGLFDTLLTVRPANDSRLKSLQREHREILQVLKELRERIRELERHVARIKAEKVAFLRMVRGHERTETRLMMDTYLVDEGGSG